MKQMEATEKMFVLEVMPLVSGFRESSVTYFSIQPYEPGALITVPLRAKDRYGIVVSASSVKKSKAEIKNANFSLRKIKKQTPKKIFRSSFLKTVQEVSDFYATSPGSVLHSLTPVSVLGNTDVAEAKEMNSKKKPTKKSIQRPYGERIQEYAEEINKVFDKGESVMVLAPTVYGAKRITEKLKDHFPDSAFELSSRLSAKKQRETWNFLAERESPTVVVLTSKFLSLSLPKQSLYILENSASESFFNIKRPHLDARLVFELMASQNGGRLLFGDVFIPLIQTKNKNTKELDTLYSKADSELISMIEDDKKSTAKQKFKLLSEELIKATDEALKENKRVFWFVSRRGLFPSTVCSDCGNEYTCEKCGSSLVLHKKRDEGEEKRIFICHRCGNQESANALCRNCESWRLEPLGIGVDRVVEEATKHFASPIVFSGDTATTKTKTKEILKNIFESEKSRLIIGTDIALPYLEENKVDVSGIVSIDSRLAIPSYTSEEMALRTMLSILSLSKEKMILQTRRKEHRIFPHYRGIDLNEFRKEESKMRKALGYPPYSTLVELAISKKKNEAINTRENISIKLKELLEKSEAIYSPVLHGTKKRGIYKAVILLKLSRDLRKAQKIRRFLRSLPPDIEIYVNPQNLW
ncbi:MAG: hypothetical protein U5L75_00960 [Candidatus Campbellbacteria bacterium]|nr:hypothetical protein [Candidatus Campbellbacteria bacterium]